MQEVKLVVIGDSFSEGLGDEPNGPDLPRGWADIAAQGWADARGEAIRYANLAIRGKLIRPIVDEQLEAALALKPTHLSFNGGGNDMLRPNTSMETIVDAFEQVLRRCDEEGVQLLLLSGANPSAGLPMKRLIQRRGDEMSAAVVARIGHRSDVITAFNWPDRELAHPSYWSQDRLHMNVRGHHRVAARVLTSLGEEPPTDWWSLPPITDQPRLSGGRYLREHLGPWVKRRLTGTSSGDGRAPKYGDWVTLTPQG